jgi:hypothetical protein
MPRATTPAAPVGNPVDLAALQALLTDMVAPRPVHRGGVPCGQSMML